MRRSFPATGPLLSGTPAASGSIAVLFGKDLAGAGITAGSFDAIDGVAITVLTSDGTLFGSLASTVGNLRFGRAGTVAVPKPATRALLGFGLVALAITRRRKKCSASPPRPRSDFKDA